MTPTRQISEYPPEEIPVRKARDQLSVYGARFHSLVKKHTRNRTVNLADEEFNLDLEKLITQIDGNGYNRGLRQMDSMHGMTDNLDL